MNSRLFGLTACALLVASCGGDSDTPPATESFDLVVSYPTPNASLAGNASDTIVTGRISSSASVNYADVKFISVNGVLAQLDLDDPSKWSARVPVNDIRALRVEAEFSNGQIVSTESALFNGLFFQPGATALDENESKAWVIDLAGGSVVEIDLLAGSARYLVRPGLGSEWAAFNSPDLCFDSFSKQLLLLTDIGLFDVDLSTGERELISSNAPGQEVGVGSPLFDARYLACDGANNRAFIVNKGDAILSVNLSNGDRSIVTGRGVGAGFALRGLANIAPDSGNDRLFVADSVLNVIYIVSLISGDRTVLSGSSAGVGPRLNIPRELVLDATNERLIVSSYIDSDASLMSVDLSTGDRAIISAAAELAAEPRIDWLKDFALDSSGNRLLLAGNESLFWIDLANSELEVITDSSVGEGTSIEQAGTVIYDPDNNRLLVEQSNIYFQVLDLRLSDASRTLLIDEQEPRFFVSDVAYDGDNGRMLALDNYLAPQLISYSLDDGRITLISGPGRGVGPAITQTGALAFDGAANTVYLTEVLEERIMKINLLSGDRTVVADNVTIGSGASAAADYSIVVNSAANELYYIAANGKQIVALDLSTLARSVIAGPTVGSGVKPRDIADIALDLSGSRLIAADKGQKQIYWVDLATGDRSTISSTDMGSGPSIECPTSVDIDLAQNRAFYNDITQDAIIMVELNTGERAAIGNSPSFLGQGC